MSVSKDIHILTIITKGRGESPGGFLCWSGPFAFRVLWQCHAGGPAACSGGGAVPSLEHTCFVYFFRAQNMGGDHSSWGCRYSMAHEGLPSSLTEGKSKVKDMVGPREEGQQGTCGTAAACPGPGSGRRAGCEKLGHRGVQGCMPQPGDVPAYALGGLCRCGFLEVPEVGDDPGLHGGSSVITWVVIRGGRRATGRCSDRRYHGTWCPLGAGQGANSPQSPRRRQLLVEPHLLVLFWLSW